MQRKFRLETTSMSLHMIAMVIMLIDHLKRVFPDITLLSCIGRIAFPIFAFLIVEGYHHTRDVKKYAQRLLIFAILSEIPSDLMSIASPFYSRHQNVLWTFLIGLALIHLNEKAKNTGKIVLRVLAAAGTIAVGYYVGMLTRVDYSQAGVLTVLTFYFFRGRKWWCFVGQLVSLGYLHFVMLASTALEFTVLGHALSIPKQGLAILALIPIWLYRGRQGAHTKGLQFLYYAFYPVHMLVIAVLAGNASPKVFLALIVPVIGMLIWRVMGEKGRGFLKTWWGNSAKSILVPCAAILLLMGPIWSMYDPVPTVMAVMCMEDQADLEEYRRTQGTGMYQIVTNRTVIKEWFNLYQEFLQEERTTDLKYYLRQIPSYAVIFFRDQGREFVGNMVITEMEVGFQTSRGSQVQHINYAPNNPYFQQVADLMAEIQK
ncbi:MAG: hypothetical protein IKC03_03630 [Oscillospiraceae bacterium]|nr:hypothetical protein [Oscillospiraceae bacterium]